MRPTKSTADWTRPKRNWNGTPTISSDDGHAGQPSLAKGFLSGALVLLEMTSAERAKWAEERVTLEANLTPDERARRNALLRERRRRADRLLALEG